MAEKAALMLNLAVAEKTFPVSVERYEHHETHRTVNDDQRAGQFQCRRRDYGPRHDPQEVR